MATDCVQRPPKTTPVTTLHPHDHLTVFTRATHLNSSRCTSMLMSNNLSAPATRLAAKPINSLRGEQLPADRDLILGEQGQIRPLMKQGRQSTFSRLHRAGKLPKSLYSHRSRVNDWARHIFRITTGLCTLTNRLVSSCPLTNYSSIRTGCSPHFCHGGAKYQVRGIIENNRHGRPWWNCRIHLFAGRQLI